MARFMCSKISQPIKSLYNGTQIIPNLISTTCIFTRIRPLFMVGDMKLIVIPNLLKNLNKAGVYQIQICSISTGIILRKKKSQHSTKIQEIVRPTDVEDVVDLIAIQNNMKECLHQLQEDFSKDFRVGADLKKFENLQISVEGEEYALSELAQITKQPPHTITVDLSSFPEYIKTVDHALRGDKLSYNPSITGTLIKIPIPRATGEHKTAVAKNAKQRCGQCKLEIHKIVKEVEHALVQEKHTSKDTSDVIKQQIKIYSDHYCLLADSLYKGKEKEILTR
ncbi:ribosome-recycling factor-like [Clavelina lepadiformis]|uniref:Ribosome-recycling factor, mitochondrial n=1 Tax=Clavelina lepadiformis TaxID=159417 RepID=A0ABP0H3Q9_CLALP